MELKWPEGSWRRRQKPESPRITRIDTNTRWDSRAFGKLEMTDIIYKEESYAILGACFNVYNDKGCGFLEPVYQECCEIEFIYQDIPHFAQKELQLTYRGQVLKQRYKPNFVCYAKIILEIKAVSQ